MTQSTIFVLMPFAKKYDDRYKLGIKQPLEDMGLKCERVDEKIFVGDILSQIIDNIKKADLVIADMTGSNPNVLYEVGFAHAIRGETTILITEDVKYIPSDLRGINHIVYGESIVKLKTNLVRAVKRLINK
ncbi:MAG: nucleotide-binding protein [Deltaproteobacteria bacterium]|nr:nucleotide-binding protein [Deltaproteobacteria bacterium]